MDIDSRLYEMTGLLRQVREADPHCRVFGSDAHRHELTPTVSEQEIVGFERAHGVTLPPEYRRFLRTAGGGGSTNCVGPYYGLIALREIMRVTEPGELARPFLLQPGEQLTPEQRDREEDYAGGLELCSMGCGSFCRLIVTGPQRGQVWLYTPDAFPNVFETTGQDFIEWCAAWARQKLVVIGNERIVARIRLGMSCEDVSALGGAWGPRQVGKTTFFEAPEVPVQLVLNAAGVVAEKRPWLCY